LLDFSALIVSMCKPSEVERLVTRMGVVVPREGMFENTHCTEWSAKFGPAAPAHDLNLIEIYPCRPVGRRAFALYF